MMAYIGEKLDTYELIKRWHTMILDDQYKIAGTYEHTICKIIYIPRLRRYEDKPKYIKK